MDEHQLLDDDGFPIEANESNALNKEENEENPGGGIRVETAPTNNGDASEAALLHGAAQVQVGPSTRSQTVALEKSDDPKSVVKRVQVKLTALRQKLVKREEDKRATGNALKELTGIFDEEKESIEQDLTILKGMLVVLRSEGSKKCAEIEKHYKEEKKKVESMNDALQKAVEGTEFVSLDELRAHFDQLFEQAKARDEKEAAILNRIGVDTIDELAERAEKVVPSDYGISSKLLKLVEDSLEKIGCDDLVEAVEEILALRETNERQSTIIAEIMSEVQVSDDQRIMQSIQAAKIHRDDLIARVSQLEHDLATTADDRDKYLNERNALAAETERLTKELFQKEKSESSVSTTDTIDGMLQRLNQLRRNEQQPATPSPPRSDRTMCMEPRVGGMEESQRTWQGQYGGGEGMVGNYGNVPMHMGSLRVNPSELPKLAPFDGTREKWKVFKEGFLLRYEHMGDVLAKQVLREVIEGKAKLEYKGLPEEYKTKSVRDCLEWLKERCFGGTLYAAMDLERKLRSQTVRGRKVDVVCQELEYLVTKLHKESSKQEEIKRMQIVFLYQDTKEYRELLKLFEKKEPYSELKKHMQMVEYMDRRESHVKSDRNANVGGNRSGTRFAGSNGVSGSHGARGEGMVCYTCRGTGHGRENCPSADSGDVRQVERQCYQCGGMGHMASSCTSPGTSKGTWKHATEGQTGAQSGVVSQAPVNGAEQSRSPPFTPILQSERATGTGRWNGQVGRVRCINEMDMSEMTSAEVRRIHLVRNNGGDENQGVFDRLQPVNGNGEDEDQEGADSLRPVVDMSDTSVGSVKWNGGDENNSVFNRLRPVNGNGKDEDQGGTNSSRPVVDKCDEHVGSVKLDGDYESKSVLNRIRPVGGNGVEENHGGVNSPRPVVDKRDRWNTVGCDDAVLNCVGTEGDVEGGGPNRLRPSKADGENECQGVLNRSQPAKVKCELDVSEVENVFFKRVVPVKGVIGGLQVEACLDTGADVNLIDKGTVDRMKDVKVNPEGMRLKITDAQGKPVKTIGTIVVDVEMDVGRKCRVGFCVSQMDIPVVLLGNSGLQAMGLELVMSERSKGVKQVHYTDVEESEAAVRAVMGEEMKEVNSVISRVVIDSTSPVHPDYSCAKCGKRELGALLSKDFKISERIREKTFGTLRELGALLDLKDVWVTCSPLDLHKQMREKMVSKEISTNALKLAYRHGLCNHSLEAAEELGKHGVELKGESGPLSDAVTEMLPTGTGRISRKSVIALVPGDSVIWSAGGSAQEIELAPYEDEPGLKQILQSMDKGKSFPKSLVILLKTSFSTKTLKAIRIYVEEIVKKVDTTVYISADLLSMKHEDLRSESIKAHQEWLTLWRIEKPRINLVVISAISGSLDNHYPLATVFDVVQKESKNIFEKALLSIVNGTTFSFEGIRVKTFPTSKRPAPVLEMIPRTGYSRSFTLPKQTFPKKPRLSETPKNAQGQKCYNCHESTHYIRDCPQPKRRPEK